MSKYLSRDAILAAQDFKTEEVEVPEWGGVVLVRELSAADFDSVGFPMVKESGEIDARGARGMNVKIVSLSVIDESGNQLFTPKDVRALGERAIAPIRRITAKAMELSGMVAEEEPEENAAAPVSTPSTKNE